MNQISTSIKQRLSLRAPLQDSLDVIADITNRLSLTKPSADPTENKEFLQQELEKIKAEYPARLNNSQ